MSGTFGFPEAPGYKETREALKEIEDRLKDVIPLLFDKRISLGTDVDFELFKEAKAQIFQARTNIRALRGLCLLADLGNRRAI